MAQGGDAGLDQGVNASAFHLGDGTGRSDRERPGRAVRSEATLAVATSVRSTPAEVSEEALG